MLMVESSSISASASSLEDQATSTPGSGPSNPKIFQGRRHMLDLVNRLHSTGLVHVAMYKLVFCLTDRSISTASRSIFNPPKLLCLALKVREGPLIESISGITLSRAAGTCTRFVPSSTTLTLLLPLALQIIKKSTRPGNASSLCILSRMPKVKYWVRRVIKHSAGSYKSQVEARIRRAQIAILNPLKPSKSFLEDEEDFGVFSNNAESLLLRGSEVADLSFVDLPIKLAVLRAGNDVDLVQRIVTIYIKRPNCIILLTVAFTRCPPPHEAVRLEGKRTIGVLIKSDRIPTGEEVNWLPFNRNEKEPLENGWFCVKQ
ncbi:hypothetical protein CVT25_006382 [Psilocybe cyanescens]|uniref:Uncharacterized protein n=1 Tax=Psilocybe cyanescens TaxID=93625 RepID=A0A409XKG2_PSICY|nr:hypothetical protein CVT25_006382 [Psilocybe cyanescens]